VPPACSPRAVRGLRGACVPLVAGLALAALASLATLPRDASASPAVADELARAEAGLTAPEWPERVGAVYALQRLGADAAPAAPRLVALLGDENGLVRMEAAEALKRIGAPSVPLLERALAADDAEERRLAAVTLGRIGLAASDALPGLRAAAASDPSPDVRDAAALAAAVVAPEGASGWARKLAYEIQDEPWGPVWPLGAFVALSVLLSLWRMVRARRDAAREVPVATTGAPPHGARPAVAGADDREDASAADGAEHEDDEEEDEADEEDEDHDDSGDDAGARAPHSPGVRPGALRRAKDGPPPPQGVAHAAAGTVAMLLGALVALLGGRSAEPDERHVAYLAGSVVALLGFGFLRLGVAGWWTQRRAAARASREAEPWLRDRAWSRDGARPVEAERVAPNLVPLVLLVAWLVPFHTVWRVPLAWWGFWLALAVFDLLGLVMLYATLVRVWRALRAGRSRLRWQGVPVRPGGTFAARFETSRSLGEVEVSATLLCLRDRAENRRIGDEAAVDADEVWADTRSFRLHARPEGGSWAQLSFPVPADARGTRSHAWRPVRWVVRVRVPTAGPDFETTFPVPVYR